MKRSQVILEIVARQHRVKVDEILSKSVKRYIVAARIDAMLSMKAEGINTLRISEALGICRNQVQYHVNPKRRAKVKAYRAEIWRQRVETRA